MARLTVTGSTRIPVNATRNWIGVNDLIWFDFDIRFGEPGQAQGASSQPEKRALRILHLTVLNPSRRAAALTRNPKRMAVFVQESRLVQSQDAASIAKMRDHPPWCRIAHVFRQLPIVLALDAADEPFEKETYQSPPLGAPKQTAYTFFQS